MNAKLHWLAQVDLRYISWAAATKVGALAVLANCFQGEAGDLILLLKQAKSTWWGKDPLALSVPRWGLITS